MTQSAIPFNQQFKDSQTGNQSIAQAEKEDYEYQAESPSFNRSPSSLSNWLGSSPQSLTSSNRSLIKTESTLIKGTSFNHKQDCSPSDHVVQTVQSLWKKLRN